MALFLGFIFLKFDLLTTIMAHCTYNMMITGVALLLSSEMYYRISGWIMILILLLPLIPGLYLTIRKRIRKETPAPENLILSHFEPSDLEQLSAFPVKADWAALSAQPDRVVLCLRAGEEILGFATGFVDDRKNGQIDGIYIQPRWRRQYWGAALLDAVQEELQNCGAVEVRVLLKPEENRSKAFIHNLFWRTRIQVFSQDNPAPSFVYAIRELINLKKGKTTEGGLEPSEGFQIPAP
jgi:GNAT superfamily N-acetyltransferase